MRAGVAGWVTADYVGYQRQGGEGEQRRVSRENRWRRHGGDALLEREHEG